MHFKNILHLSTALVLAGMSFSTPTLGMEKTVHQAEDLSLTAEGLSVDQRLQHLENERDQADWSDYPRFKELTATICNLIGGPFDGDAYEDTVLSSGEPLHRWIDSIIRTRHKFSGQPCLGAHGMMNRYTNDYSADLSYAYEHHIATIMTIDAMAKLAITDDEFYDRWAGVKEDAQVPEDFIKSVLSTLEDDSYGKTKPGMYRVKAVARSLLQKNASLVRLAGDIFQLYAPKIDLKMVYSDLMVSGGTYRGWEIVGLDSFARIVIFTEEQNTANPGMELEVRNYVNRLIQRKGFRGLYSTTAKAFITDNLSIGEIPHGEVRYVFKIDLIDNQGRPMLMDSARPNRLSFLLKREIKSEILHLSLNEIISIKNKNIKDICEVSSDAYIINARGNNLLNGMNGENKDIEQAINYFREAFYLGHYQAREILKKKLNECALEFVLGQDKNFPKAIELLRETTALGFESAEKNLGLALNEQAIDLTQGINGTEKDLPKGIELLREAAALEFEPARQNLAIALSNWALLHKKNSA